MKRLVTYCIVIFFLIAGIFSAYSCLFSFIIKNNLPLLYALSAVVIISLSMTGLIIRYARDDYLKLRQKYKIIAAQLKTENKKIIEDRYKLNQLWNNALLEASSDAIFIETLDGSIFDCNSAAVKLYGYTRGELLSMHVRDLLPEKEASTIPQIIEKELANGGFHIIGENVKKDKTVFPCEVTTRLVTIAEESLIVVYVHDLTRQKEQEEMIRRSEERYHAIVEGFDGLIYICSQQQKVEFINKRFIAQCGENISGKTCYQSLYKRNVPCSWCVSDRVFNGETVKQEILNPKDNRWYYIISTPLYNADGTISQQSVILDIDERKRAEDRAVTLNSELEESIARLKFANQELESYTYTVSHDLKAPLATIGGYARMLLKKYSDVLDEKGMKFLQIIMMDVNRLESLIQDLLELSRLRFHSLEKEIIDVEKMIHAIVSSMRGKHSAKIHIDRLPAVNADKKLLYQVFVNLISNAIKYSNKKESPIIEIRGWAENDRLIYSVKDNGVGFDPQYKDRVFDAFQRLHSKDEYEGSGVGLNIVQRIILYHRGKVWADSTPGEGSVFYISFPGE